MLDERAIRVLLDEVADGTRSIDDAIAALRGLPFEDLGFAKIDHHRAIRQGFAEVVYCEGKTTEQIAAIVQRIALSGAPVLGTRASLIQFEAARVVVEGLEYDEPARIFWRQPAGAPPRMNGVVIVAAGTSDLPVAREAEITLNVMGHDPQLICDVGVAGLHRLLEHLEPIQSANVIIAVAGMEGALPSVVAGLVAVPVIAVPTSVGYGASFGGVAALLAMLNSCAAGVGVVNIDNGYGAAHLAAMINKAAVESSGGADSFAAGVVEGEREI